MAMRTVPKIYVRKLSLRRPRGKVWGEFDGVTKYVSKSTRCRTHRRTISDDADSVVTTSFYILYFYIPSYI